MNKLYPSALHKTSQSVMDDLSSLFINAMATNKDFYPFDTMIHASLLDNFERYERHPALMDALSQAFASYMAGVKGEALMADSITILYDQFGGNHGQFMTPPVLSYDAALLLSTDVLEKLGNGEMITIADPCCGTGSMILGFLRTLVARVGPSGLNQVHIIINDADVRMVRLCIMNIMSSALVHGVRIGNVTAYCSDVISQYHNGPMVFKI